MFYLNQITTDKDGVTAKALFDYATQDEAVLVLHQVLASAMANQDVIHALCMIFNEAGTVLKSECWDRPIEPEPEPEPTPEEGE